MAFKDLLVHIDDTKACDRRVAAAIMLARTHDAHLTGLYIGGAMRLPTYVDAELPRQVIEDQQKRLEALAWRRRSRFTEAAEKNGLVADCRIETDSFEAAPSILARHARYADLTIVGQSNPDEAGMPGPDVVESAFLSSGRPALVVPYIGAQDSIGKRVLIAWDGSREATRAVNDALPILVQAKPVIVLAVNPNDGGHRRQPGADIAHHLARHGVSVDCKATYANDIGIGDTILSRAADESVDLIVMGAYGHSRLREMVLGGVTRHMLRHMTVPVFMSH